MLRKLHLTCTERSCEADVSKLLATMSTHPAELRLDSQPVPTSLGVTVRKYFVVARELGSHVVSALQNYAKSQLG